MGLKYCKVAPFLCVCFGNVELCPKSLSRKSGQNVLTLGVWSPQFLSEQNHNCLSVLCESQPMDINAPEALTWPVSPSRHFSQLWPVLWLDLPLWFLLWFQATLHFEKAELLLPRPEVCMACPKKGHTARLLRAREREVGTCFDYILRVVRLGFPLGFSLVANLKQKK